MTNNLNQNLYSRFGLKLDVGQVVDGFQSHMKNVLLEDLAPIIWPDRYDQKNELYKIQESVLREGCRQLFVDYDNYDNSMYGAQWFLEKEFYEEFEGDFNDYLFRLQVLLNILYQHRLILNELAQVTKHIEAYLSDYPILGVTIKIYKKKSPQILPTSSQKFEEEIKNTLGLLEADKKFEHTLTHFEDGLKEFLTAKTQANYKDVIEDMYTACDELVKAVTGDNNKGFKHISDKAEAVTLGLNGHQKESFKNLRNWMDDIKHGTLKDFDGNDTEMIISMVGSLIRFVILKQKS